MLDKKATPIPFSNQREDRLSWGLSPSGDFKLKDAYHIANANDLKPMNWPYNKKRIWKVPTLPKIKFFLWQCSHDSIPVCALLANKDCPKAQSFWNSFSPPCSATSFYDTQLMVWLRINCKLMQQCNATKLDWAIIFLIAV
ncbi:putative ribonuclease h protein [Quercus suber]|uniref:Ribonuclease h protein n=1 Tax=Quercus suber TaxID=58331 RepID=A0AAW0KCL3_QUESU